MFSLFAPLSGFQFLYGDRRFPTKAAAIAAAQAAGLGVAVRVFRGPKCVATVAPVAS